MKLYQNTDELRLATIGTAEGEAAYRSLIEFDPEMCSDYEGFKEACSRIGLPCLSVRDWGRVFDKTMDDLD
jgi:hypothetical protein